MIEPVLLGCGLAAGVLLAIDGAIPRTRESATAKRHILDHRRLLTTTALAVVSVGITRWPIAGVAVGALAWFGPALLGVRSNRDRAVQRIEAIASWTEMLRDTINAAHGLEGAIIATAAVSPAAIQADVALLASRLDRESLPDALAALAEDLDHPIGDLVVAALVAAATTSTRDLADLLSTLAAVARDEASMQLRVEAGRARVRTAVRVITTVTVTTASALVLLNPTYVDVYRSLLGQVVLVFVFGCWAVALTWLGRMSRFEAPERFLASGTASGGVR